MNGTLPDGLTIEHALSRACRIAGRIAPDWLHRDEIDSAAGEGLMRAMARYDGSGDGRWWRLLRKCIRGAIFEARKDWLSHGVVNRGGRGLLTHKFEDQWDSPSYSVNLAAGIEAEETMAGFAPKSRRVVELLGRGHTPADVAAMTGDDPNEVYAVACWARRRLQERAA